MGFENDDELIFDQKLYLVNRTMPCPSQQPKWEVKFIGGDDEFLLANENRMF